MGQQFSFALRLRNDKFHRKKSRTECATTPMAASTSKVAPTETILIKSKYFCEKHKNDAIIGGMGAWDLDLIHHIGIELVLFRKHRHAFFNAASRRDVEHRSFATREVSRHYSNLVSICKRARSTSSLRELVDHTTVAPSEVLRSLITGMKKIVSNSAGLIEARSSPAQHLSCLVRASSRIYELITGNSVLAQINERLPATINVGV